MEGLKTLGSKEKEPKDQEATTTTASTPEPATKDAQILSSDSDTRPATISDPVALSPSPSVTPVADHLDTSTRSTSISSTPTAHTSTKVPYGTGVPSAKNVSTTALPIKDGSGPAPPLLDPGRGDGRQEVIEDYEIPKIYWSKLPEHFPIPTDSLIQIPTGKPKAIPKIQYEFHEESMEDKRDRKKKLEQIKKTFEFSWDGYVKNAWMQDELSPVSGKYRNPFCGWAATLVDSLDTLWIMGMFDQFDNATAAVKDIDFTTSPRKDIPMFETTIRYLGGLLGAYDISGRTPKYIILLEKAIELADILMGAFDTPNRMPMTFYYWDPAFASQPHRALTKVVLAELGSMSVEFTRLAQITKDAKYYDAIARITNEFEMWQNNTKIPGLWPKSVDASGCKKPSLPSTPVQKPLANGPGNLKVQTQKLTTSQDLKDGQWVWSTKGDTETASIPKVAPEGSSTSDDSNRPLAGSPEWLAAKSKGHSHGPEVPTDTHETAENSLKQSSKSSVSATQLNHNRGKRQLQDDTLASTSKPPKQPDCEPQGLATPPNIYNEEFTLGGQADSVYEYLPKEYMLLGGLEDQYRTMYEATLEPIEKHLLFRPMIPDEKREILFAGQVTTSGTLDNPTHVKLKAENSHLTCFMGGMYAVGAKIFDRESDMDIARKLTDGCVWSYEATVTGIMPEYFIAIPCDDIKTCPWNETKWYEALAPRGSRQFQDDDAPATPVKVVLDDNPDVPESKKDLKVDQVKSPADNTDKLLEENQMTTVTTATPKASVAKSLVDSTSTSIPGSLKKRQLDMEKEIEKLSDSKVASPPAREPSKTQVDSIVLNPKGNDNREKTAVQEEIMAADEEEVSKPIEPVVPKYTPPPIPTQEEYAKSRIKDERLPKGVARIEDRKYILR